MTGQALGSGRRTGGANRQYLGMGSGIGQFTRPVPGSRDHLSARVGDDSADGNLAALRRRSRLCQSLCHMGCETRHIRLSQAGPDGASGEKNLPRSKDWA